MEHVEFARNNEEFSEDVRDDYPEQNNWVVTIQFYSFLHYVEERLRTYGYAPTSHDERQEDIMSCRHIDRQAYKIYRSLYDTSRDARYECVRIEDDEVGECRDRLEEGKNILGYSGGGGSTKYST